MTSTNGPIPGKLEFATERKLEGKEPAVTELQRAQAFWCLRRYSSIVYIERAQALLSKFNDGLKGEASRETEPYTIRSYMGLLAELYRYQSEYEKGLELLRHGNRRGYNHIREGAKVASYFESRTWYDGSDFDASIAFGPRNTPRVGLAAWGRHAYLMARNILRTFDTEWTYQLFQDPRPAASLSPLPIKLDPAPYPAPGAPLCSPGDIVPIGGLWLPIDRRLGCPNYLRFESPAPYAMSTVSVLEEPRAKAGDLPSYMYERRPSRWELCWEDKRYAVPMPLVDALRTIPSSSWPDESEFLGDDVSYPNEPLLVLPRPQSRAVTPE